MSNLINRKTQFKAVRFPHLILEGIDEKLNNSLSFSAWIKEAAKEKLLKDDDYNVDELTKEYERAKQRNEFLLNEEEKNKNKLIKMQKKQDKLNRSN